MSDGNIPLWQITGDKPYSERYNMNNRLLELAQEAELSANLGNAIDIKLMMKNYAQLIIQECMEQCFSEDDEQRIAKHFWS